MPKKKTYEEVKQEFENRGYILISKEYINNKSKLKYICPIHNEKIQYITYDSLRQGCGCYYCGIERRNNKNRLDYSYVYNEFLKRDYQLLQENYNNANEKMEYVCNKHPDFVQSITYANLQQGHGCKYCAIETRSNKKKVKFNDVQKLFQKRGYILLSTQEDYVNNKSLLEYRCVKHKDAIQKISYNSLWNGQGCYFCGKERVKQKLRKNFHDVREVFKRNGYILLSKEEEYENANSKLRYVCPKHPNEELYTTYSSIYNGEGCPLCKQSKGEKAISKILDELCIEYTKQKKFDDLKDKRKLSYDFYIPGHNLLIEYQGAYHDGLVHENNPKLQTKEDLENQQKRDNLKRQYAKDNNYRLLEIWYWDYKNIESILRSELNI